MNDKITKKDLVGDLFRKHETEKAPEGFADRIMQAISEEAVTTPQAGWNYSTYLIWGAIFIGLASLAVAVFLLDFSFMGSVFEGIESDTGFFRDYVLQAGNTLGKWFTSISLSALSVMILLALGALFLLDHLLRKSPRTQTHML